MDWLTQILLIVLFLLVIILVILIISSYRKKLSQNLLLLNNIPSEIYNSEYGDLEYLLQGEGPTILVSHGITGGIDQGIGMTENYIGSGYRLLYISRFGYLKSTIPDNASVELQADAYSELLDHLGIAKSFIFGNSAGGTSALQFALRHPEKCSGLVLVSSNAPLDDDPGHPPKFVFQIDFLYWFFMKLIGRFMLAMFVPKKVLNELSKERKRTIMEDIYFSALPVSKRKEGIMFDLFISNPSINDDIPFKDIKSPTLILNAVDDPATRIEGARILAKEIQTSILVTYDSGGHLLVDQEDAIKNNIRKFITSVENDLKKK